MDAAPHETWLTVGQVAALANITVQAIRKAAEKATWRGCTLTVRKAEDLAKGGGASGNYLILLSSLPPDLQLRYHEQQINPPANQYLVQQGQLVVRAPDGSIPPPPDSLADWQRQCQDARRALVGHVETIRLQSECRLTVRAAADQLVKQIEAGTAPEELRTLVPVALAKRKGKATLSLRTLQRWIEATGEAKPTGKTLSPKTAAAKTQVTLAPKAPARIGAPTWAATFLKIYQHPNKPSLHKALGVLMSRLPPEEQPSYHQVRRYMMQLSPLERMKGRLGPRELKKMRAYVARDTSSLWPTDVYTSDGHTFDAEVQHPDHGRPFRPEITAVEDAATRLVVGWSTALAESTWSVMDAMRSACTAWGIPAVWYTDRGPGFANEQFSHQVTGFLARLGISPEKALPYNSQARGMIERIHRTIWVDAARTLPSYMGDDADPERRHLIYKESRKDIAERGCSRHILPWLDFLQLCERAVAEYNSRPHRALPRITDETGKTRHMTPLEAWKAATEEGFVTIVPTPGEADDLFRPYKIARCVRCCVTLWNNSYFHKDLEAFHGQDVQVGYDIHDASRVWVRSMDGRLVAVAEWDGNKRDYFPMPVIEQARAKREAGRVLRLQRKIEEARLEGSARPITVEPEPVTEEVREVARLKLLELAANAPPADPEPAPVELSPALAEPEIINQNNDVPDAITEARPDFTSDIAYWRWAQEHPSQVTAQDTDYLEQRLRDSAMFRFQVEQELAVQEAKKKSAS